MSNVSVEGLTHRYHPRGEAMLEDVSFNVPDGSITCLLGPSGSGKSTILGCIAGLHKPSAGTVLVDGVDLAPIPTHRRPVTLLMQNAQLFAHMTVAQNVEFGLKVRRVSPRTRRHRSVELLDMVGLGGFAGRDPGQLSGGEQQRVALARALATEPAVLLADEPLGNLDPPVRRDLQRQLVEINRSTGTTVLFVTHDVTEALAISDQLVVIDGGRVQSSGIPGELLRRPGTRSVADLLGVGNVLTGRIEGDFLDAAAGRFRVDPAHALPTQASTTDGDRHWVIHPDHVHVVDACDADASTPTTNAVSGIAVASRLIGTRVELCVAVGSYQLTAVVASELCPPLGATVTVRLPTAQLYEVRP